MDVYARNDPTDEKKRGRKQAFCTRLLVQNAFNIPQVQVRANACSLGGGVNTHTTCQTVG